jgi:magnesium transporter
MTETDTRNGAIGGQLGATAPRDTTFHGRDPDTVATDTICHDTPTHCQARTRLYRDGRLVEQGFAIERISDHLTESRAMIWLDLRNPDAEDLSVLQEEFGLHPVAIEDARVARERPKIDRYRTHLFLTAYSARLDMASGELATSELAAFILPQALITIRKDDGLDIGKVVERWDGSPDLAANGVGYLVHGLLDYIVDGHFEAVQSLDDAVEGLEDDLFAPPSAKHLHVQRRSFELRKSLVLLRRVVLPMREVLNTVMRRDLRHVNEELMPYYQDVYDHVLRAAEWTESLRDLVTTILETNLTIQGNRMNVITKKVTGWAAIIAVPTFITGFYGMNVPYPGFSDHVGFIVAAVIMVGSGVLLYWTFRRNDWLLSRLARHSGRPHRSGPRGIRSRGVKASADGWRVGRSGVAGWGRRPAGLSAENSVASLSRSRASSWISSSVGDRLITSVTMKVMTVIPTSSGTRNDTPVLPLMADIEPMDTRIAAIPV